MIFKHAREREDVADIVIDHENRLARHHRVGIVEVLQHLPLLLGQLGLDAVQEERCFIQ